MAFVNISVNIVAEYSGLCEAVAQEFLEEFDRINMLLAHCNVPATIEPDYVVDFSYADQQRQYVSKFPVEYMRRLRRAYAKIGQVCAMQVVCLDGQARAIAASLQTPMRHRHSI